MDASLLALGALGVLYLGARSPKLSRHFTEAQLTRTDTGLSNKLPRQLVPNARKLGAVLDDIYDASGGIGVTSAYRSPAVNGAVDGASASRHLQALGADIYSTTGMAAAGLFQLVSGLALPLDELLLYPTHIHIAVTP